MRSSRKLKYDCPSVIPIRFHKKFGNLWEWSGLSLLTLVVAVFEVISTIDLSAFAQATNSTNSTSSQPTSSHFLTYQNATAGFTLQYPSYFQKFENSTSNSSAVYFVEPLSGARFTVANFKIPQVNLLNEPKNLIVSTYLNGFTESFQPYNITRSNFTTISGNPANKTEITYFYADHPATITILSSLIGDKVYILSYAATNDNYALFLPTVQQMIRSFSIKPAAASTS
jgi:hypothetical protein